MIIFCKLYFIKERIHLLYHDNIRSFYFVNLCSYLQLSSEHSRIALTAVLVSTEG